MQDTAIYVIEPHGFCSGVRAAVKMARHALSVYGEVWCLHELVHNGAVVDELRKKGIRFVECLEDVPEGGVVLFAAHGVAPCVRAQAAVRGLKVIDATCPFVARAHRQVREFSERGVPVVVVGNAEHVEVVGLVGEYKEFKVVKEFKEIKGSKGFKVVKESKGSKGFKEFKVSNDPNDLNDLNDPNDPNDLKDPNDLNDLKVVKDAAEVGDLPFPEAGPVGVVCQTTLSSGTVHDVLSALRARYPHLLESPASDTCTATRDRQRAVGDFVRAGDPSATGVLVIGSANSSNTARLVEIAREAGASAWRVDGPDELSVCDFAGIERLGLTAGASTPEAIVSDIAARLGRI